MSNRAALTAFEFFAGGGLAGLGLAADGRGFRTTFANDLDAAKARSFAANHALAPTVADVWDLTAPDLPGRPDLCWASSPCQDLSLAGARGGLGARRSGAFWGFWRLIQGLDAEGRGPRLVVVENVVGLLTSAGGGDFAAVCGAMAEAGYTVGALEMDAAGWLPQSRPRLFIVGVRDGAAPRQAGPSRPFHSERLIAAYDRLPPPTRAAWAWWRLDAPPQRNADLGALLVPDDQARWFDPEETARLLALLGPLHRARLEAAIMGGRRTVGAAFRRIRTEQGRKVQRLELRFDGLAGCLRTPSGGSSRQYVVAVEDGQVRARRLTGRECARLMGAGDDYVLPPSESAALKLMGDAVAVPVVRALTEGLLLPALGRAADRAA